MGRLGLGQLVKRSIEREFQDAEGAEGMLYKRTALSRKPEVPRLALWATIFRPDGPERRQSDSEVGYNLGLTWGIFDGWQPD